MLVLLSGIYNILAKKNNRVREHNAWPRTLSPDFNEIHCVPGKNAFLISGADMTATKSTNFDTKP